MKKLLVSGFSFETIGASAGDLIAHDIVCACLDEIGKEYDVALTAPFSGVDFLVERDSSERS